MGPGARGGVTLAFQAALRARAQARPRTVVFPEGDEPRTIEVVSEIIRERLLRPVLLGEPEAAKDALAAAGCDPTSVSVVDPSSDTDRYALELLELRRSSALTDDEARDQAQARAREPLFRAALMVRKGEADGSVAGTVHTTGEVLRAAFACVGPAAGIHTVSSSFYMVVQDFRGRGEEVISFTDAGVVPEPTPQQLSDIAFAAVRARALVVGDEPRVAFLSYSDPRERLWCGRRSSRGGAPPVPGPGSGHPLRRRAASGCGPRRGGSAAQGARLSRGRSRKHFGFSGLGRRQHRLQARGAAGCRRCCGPDHPGAREAFERRLPWGPRPRPS